MPVVLKEHLTQDGWTTEVPTEPGLYWFLRESIKRNGEGRIVLADVRENQQGLIYIGDDFLFTAESRRGWWQKVVMPSVANIGFTHVHESTREDKPDYTCWGHEGLPPLMWSYEKREFRSVAAIRMGNYEDPVCSKWVRLAEAVDE